MGKATQQNTVSNSPGNCFNQKLERGGSLDNQLEPRSNSSYKVISTPTTMKIEGHPTWIHVSKVKPCNSFEMNLLTLVNLSKILNSCSKTALDKISRLLLEYQYGWERFSCFLLCDPFTYLYILIYNNCWKRTRRDHVTTLKQISVQQEFLYQKLCHAAWLIIQCSFGEGQVMFCFPDFG